MSAYFYGYREKKNNNNNVKRREKVFKNNFSSYLFTYVPFHNKKHKNKTKAEPLANFSRVYGMRWEKKMKNFY